MTNAYASGDTSDCVVSMYSSLSVTSTVACVRGGAADDNYPRRSNNRGDFDDRDKPPRRTPPPYIDRSDRDRRRPGPRPMQDDVSDRPRRPSGDRGDERYNNRYERGDRRGYDDRDHRPRPTHGGVRPKREPDNDLDLSAGGKTKGWFGSKKTKPANANIKSKPPTPDAWSSDTSFPPPPPPPPPPVDATNGLGININPAETERTPIHYMFPTAEAAAEERQRDDKLDDREANQSEAGAPDLPFLDVDEDDFTRRGDDDRRRRRRRSDDDDEVYASPRRDAVTMYMSTRRGAFKVRFGSVVVGATLGAFIGKVSVCDECYVRCIFESNANHSYSSTSNKQSLMNDPFVISFVTASLLFIAGFLRNDYGELSRALGLAFLLTCQRTSSVRKEYPTLVHLKAMIRQGPRKPFPPVDEGDSPWKYEPIYEDDPEFKMTYALLAMAMVGSFCGGNVPLLPAWMGGIVGAVVFASLTSGANARGDLGRTMGMRVVGLLQLVLTINSELRILGKAATVGGLIFDKIMIMDRKHRIKDKIVAIFKWGADKVSNTAADIQADMQDR
jgi:hypothetical protein